MRVKNFLQRSRHNSDISLIVFIICVYPDEKGLHKIEDILNEEFSTLCWKSLNKKWSIYFGVEKTKYILFFEAKHSLELNTCHRNQNIKLFDNAKYLGCHLDCNVSADFMAKVF